MPKALRTLPLIVAGGLLLAAAGEASAQAGFSLDDFTVDSGQDLLDVCTLSADRPSYWEAQAFCFGYFQGGADFHQALMSGPAPRPIACPPDGATIRDAVTLFVDYARAHPESLEQAPMDLVFRAVAEEWPCS
jgi:hypothetical protein